MSNKINILGGLAEDILEMFVTGYFVRLVSHLAWAL